MNGLPAHVKKDRADGKAFGSLLVVGLTGGIASGKSTVAAIFRSAGAFVIDADQIAREVVNTGRSAWREIKTAFGEKVMHPDGAIDRKALAALVFGSDRLRKQLEQIVHPRVRSQMNAETMRAAQTDPSRPIIQEVPLLLESGMDAGLAEIIVVYAPEEVQLQRLIKRDRISRADAVARIRAQMPIEQKKQRATIVIDNSGSPSDTEKQTLGVYKTLKRRARKGT